jgi:hypothetical protein
MSAAIPSPDMKPLWGTRMQAIRWDVHRSECRFELENFASLVFASIQYSRFEFDETAEHEVVELVSVQAEPCVLGTRLFGELSHGTFEFVCASVRIDRTEPGP